MSTSLCARGTAALLTLLAALVLGPALPGGAAAAQDPGPGIHPVIVLAGEGGGTAVVRLHLRRVQVDGAISSYQGEVSYDTRALTLSRAELPQGVAGAWNEPAPGRVRFAGASPQGVGDVPVLTLHFRTRGPVEGSGFRVKMEEVVSAIGFRSLSARVVRRDPPIFSRAPAR
ncbi:MAG TPA: hypothetical protein VF263_25600 [Longimicrobiaceae bacterium]